MEKKVQIGVICYDLQNFTADFLNRLFEETRNFGDVTAYPIMDSVGDIEIKFNYLTGQNVIRHKVKTYSNNEKHTPEGILITPNLGNALLCAYNSDIILHYGIHSSTALISSFVGFLFRRKQISVNQTIPVVWELKRKWWIRWSKKMFFKLCDHHVGQSNVSIDNLTQVYKISPKKISYIPFEAGIHSFNVKYQSCHLLEVTKGVKNNNGFTLLFVGNLLRFKGVYLLIDAVKQLLDLGNQYNLIIVGPESIEKSEPRIQDLKNYVIDLGLENFIQILGPKSLIELVPIYKQSDVFILPTMKDCFPKVMVEAGIAGKPMISSDACGAVGTILIDSINGFVFKAGSVEALAEAILKISNFDLINKMSKETERIIKNYLDETREESKLFSDLLYRIA